MRTRNRQIVTALLLLVGFAGQAAAPVPGWRIVRQDGEPYAAGEMFPGTKFPLREAHAGPVLLEWRDTPVSKDIGLLIYRTGIEGAGHPYKVERALIIDKRSGKFLGQGLWRYDPVGPAPILEQPDWQWSKDGVKIIEEDELEVSEIRWGQ